MQRSNQLRSSRLLSLDVFRGITIVLMIIVNSPGNQTAYSWFEHSAWNGCTLADLVFPFFVMIVGVSSVFTLSQQRDKGLSIRTLYGKIVQRTVFLFVIGLLLNALPLPSDWSTLRLPGVLQRIAICYCACSMLYLSTRLSTQAFLIMALLVFYWLVMACFPVPGYGANNLTREGNVATFVDTVLLSPNHLYRKGFDPEGIFSTLPAIATALLGNLIGAWLLTNHSLHTKQWGLVIAGFLAALLGWLWGFVFPINKALWSSSYVLWTGGLGLLLFALCYWLIEVKQWKKWSRPFELFGINALTAYILHVVCLKIQAMILIPVSEGIPLNARLFITHKWFGWAHLEMASLLYAVSYTGFWFVVLRIIPLKKLRKMRYQTGRVIKD